MPVPFVVEVSDSSQVGEVRRAALRLAEVSSFNEVDQGRLAIVATELTTNTLRHAVRGSVLLQASNTPDGDAVELLAIDHGPGIASIDYSMRDGHSTGGTPGNGLGALKRLSDQFDIYSQLDKGTVVLSRICSQARPPQTAPVAVWSGICTPIRHETECGDAWCAIVDSSGFLLMVADGLGHGPEAALASSRAVEVLRENVQQPPAIILQRAHLGLSGTRGAAVAVAGFSAAGSVLRYAGVGNISGTLVSGGQRRGMASHNGTVGSQVRKVQEFEYPYSPGDLIIMHSDGLQTHWSLDPYPGLVTRHPAVIAGVLYRDFRRGRDDASVVVVRIVAARK